tara:strand:+ start:123576 stop:123977 length:402 start_codon:yes stop_codon:yes gene_type:complete
MKLQSIHTAKGPILSIGNTFFLTDKRVIAIEQNGEDGFFVEVTLRDAYKEETIRILTMHGKRYYQERNGDILVLKDIRAADRETGIYAIPLQYAEKTKKQGFWPFVTVLDLYDTIEMDANYVFVRMHKAWIKR